jgi:hypothetical protein
MPKPVTAPEQIAQRPPEISDYPDLISDTTVAFAMCKAVPDIVDGEGGAAPPQAARVAGLLGV